jgi:hypothetical protein
VLAQQKKGRGYELLRGINAKYTVVTFPMKMLTGRNIGFAARYAEAFEKEMTFTRKFETGDELAYILRRGN